MKWDLRVENPSAVPVWEGRVERGREREGEGEGGREKGREGERGREREKSYVVRQDCISHNHSTGP